MKDLTKTTLIIPVKVEHNDRYRNAKNVLNFLNSNVKTNVFIYEISDNGETKLDFINELNNLKISHWILPNESPFHRTKYLNIMLDKVETPVVVNYDIDVLLDPNNMLECQNTILRGESLVIYPYELGLGQIQVYETFDYNGFEKSGYSIDFINNSDKTNTWYAECGHCIFFNTVTYRDFGGENENFISYGPEDKERLYRFQILSNSVSWRDGQKVYHLEHYRGNDSWTTNPSFAHNWSIFDSLKGMSGEGLMEYYKNSEYTKKYPTISKNSHVLAELGEIGNDIEKIVSPPKIIQNQNIQINQNDPSTLR